MAWMALLVVVPMWSGCRSTPTVSMAPMSAPPACVNTSRDPEVLVGLAVSGGGSRAAIFSAGAFEALSQLRAGADQRSLLEQVSYISSVSGGSLASAYYALRKPPGTIPILTASGDLTEEYRQFFATFKDTMAKNYERPLFWRNLLFWRWVNPPWTAKSLSEILEKDEYYGENRFANLAEREARRDSPRLLINTTLYNNGRRLVLSTLPRGESNYSLLESVVREVGVDRLGEGFIEKLAAAPDELVSVIPEDLSIDVCPVLIARSVAASMSFPPIIGPVTLKIEGQERYWHIGDGGIADNTGSESLLMVFLKKLQENKARRALVIMVDSSFPFSVGGKDLDNRKEGFTFFDRDYSRIPSIMEERSLAYRGLFALLARQLGVGVFPPSDRLGIVRLRHTDAQWAEDLSDLPESCQGQKTDWKNPKDVGQHMASIVTRLSLKSDCDRDLIIAAAKKVVAANADMIRAFLDQGRAASKASDPSAGP
jgi:predicted acylesterase/phospholipase RssA